MLVQKYAEQLVDTVRHCREMQNMLPLPARNERATFSENDRRIRIAIQSNRPDMLDRCMRERCSDHESQQNGVDDYLILASYYGFVPCMNILIENGANINYESSTGHTPLMKAIGSRNLDAVKLLVSKGSDVSHTTPTGITTQSVAEILGDQAIIELIRPQTPDNLDN